ncbi:hypothetical protein CesoFtcFv8_003182 [Champsocephalus esox]|uniref:Uncharacterized protein n=1 Tax=Champsocephalus esox TaxID=159716 RepID=A0AAN8HE52_9TELE|nr:hypothetical protein CesoFtcFv8_003182 [Champsocephalus esox]
MRHCPTAVCPGASTHRDTVSTDDQLTTVEAADNLPANTRKESARVAVCAMSGAPSRTGAAERSHKRKGVAGGGRVRLPPGHVQHITSTRYIQHSLSND